MLTPRTIQKVTILLILCLVFARSYAQIPAPIILTNEQSLHFNNLEKFTKKQLNVDSAYFNVQLFAARADRVSLPLLLGFIHDSFAPNFVTKDSILDPQKANGFSSLRLFSKALLSKMANDSSKILSENVRSLYYLVQIQDASNDEAKIATLIHRFMNEDLAKEDMYIGKSGRYGVKIYESISKRKELSSVADQLFKALENRLILSSNIRIDFASNEFLSKRASLRYQYASLSSLKANNSDNAAIKEEFLKKSFEFSPDRTDVTHSFEWVHFKTSLFGFWYKKSTITSSI